MIPILYDKDEQTFNHNGIGFLIDTIKCTVTEERNGKYELVLQYPIKGRHYERITDGAIVKAKANETSDLQLFRIYKSSKPLNGIVTFNAEHISYELNGIPLINLSLTNVTALHAITTAFQNSVLPHNYNAWSDITSLHNITLNEPCSLRAVLGGQENSILDTWHGEYEFDNYNVRLHENRGSDNGITIEYGKNLTDIKQDSNINECYTHLLPYLKYNIDTENGQQEAFLYLNEKTIALPTAENIGHNKVYIMEFSDFFTETDEKTEATLREKATAFVQDTNLGVPKINITVSFVQLWQTEEYKNIAPLERVCLCDIVTVRFPKLGINAKSKVIETVYDTLNEKYETITLGEAKSTLADTLNKQSNSIRALKKDLVNAQGKVAKDYKEAIKNATDLITGNKGGYVVLNPAERPQEVLILNTPNIETATKVWRWNGSGLGYSKTGYNGDYSLAMTMDGKIVADFITAGTLSGIEIIADNGTIGGWTIETHRLYNNKNATAEAGINDYEYGAAIYAGANNDVSGNNAPFRVYHDGSMYAYNAVIQGNITSNYGKIGEWDISPNGISKTAYIWESENSAHNYRVALQSYNNGTTDYPSIYVLKQEFDGTNWYDQEMTFYVSPIGHLYAKSAEITGHIYAKTLQVNNDVYVTNQDFGHAVKMLHAQTTGSTDTEYDVGRCSKNIFDTYNFIRFWESSQFRYATFHNNGIYADVLGKSDQRLKNSIEELPEKYLEFFKKIKPKRFKFNEGTSNRYHTGFIANEIAQALQETNIDTAEFAGYVEGSFSNSEKDKYDFDNPLALRYDEFVALNTLAIQEALKKCEQLEQAILNITGGNTNGQ